MNSRITNGTSSVTESSTVNKYLPFDLDIDTTAIADVGTGFLDPERLIPLLQEHKSGIIVAGLWLTLRVRSWLSLLPVPSFTFSLCTGTLVFAVLAAASVSTDDASCDGTGDHKARLTGLPNFFLGQTKRSAASLFGEKVLPPWLTTHALPLVVLFPLRQAATLLLYLAVLRLAKDYRAGVTSVDADVDAAVGKAHELLGKVGEHAHTAKALEMQALQMAAGPAAGVAREIKMEVEGVVNEAAVLTEKMIDKARKLAEGAKRAVREEGDLEFSREMVAALDASVEKLIEAELKLGCRVEKARQRLWKVSLA